MTAQQKIQKFIAKYGENIRKDYMPSILLGGTMINSEFKEKNGTICYNFYSKVFVPYLLYDEKLDVLAVAIGSMSSNKRDGLQREWTGTVYYIVDHEKKVVNKNGESPYCYYGKETCYYARFFLDEFKTNEHNICSREIKRFLGETFRWGSRLFGTRLWCLKEWFVQKNKKDASNEIIKLGDVSDIKLSTQEIDYLGYTWRPAIRTTIENNGRYDIIRCFSEDKETERIYFDTQTDKIIIFYCTNGIWQKATTVNKYSTYLVDKNLIDTYFEKTKRLKYLEDIVSNNKQTYVHSFWAQGKSHQEETNFIELSVFKLIKILRYPILEKLYRAGYKNIYDNIDKGCPKADITQKFGVYNDKAKTIYKVLGLNKFQLDLIDNKIGKNKNNYYVTSAYKVLNGIKAGLNMSNISDLNNEQFQSLYTFVEQISSGRYGYTYYDRRAFWKEYESFANNISKFTAMANRMNRIAKNFSGIYQTYNDMINMYDNCKRELLNVVDLNFEDLKDQNDFVRLHDYYTNMHNAHVEECRRNYDKAMKERHEKMLKNYEKIYKERTEKYEYGYGDYLFKIPKNPQEELTNEGRVLSHCVGGYSERVLSGNTNIVFLREKAAPEIPFMTIEINGEKVVQIHGSHNAWLGSCEKYQKAIPAVMHWLYDKKIKCNVNILTSKATGYSSYGAESVELPKVSFNVKEILM